MNRTAVEQEVVTILRESTLRGSSREVASDRPLGALGLGLDSLALVGFIVALENHYKLEIPESIWTEREQMTLDHLVEIIAESAADDPMSPPPDPTYDASIGFDESESRLSRFAVVYREHGVIPAISWLTAKTAGMIGRSIYESDRHYLLSFDLEHSEIPQLAFPGGLTFRHATLDDLPSTDGLWHPSEVRTKRRLFRERIQNGYQCYSAWSEASIVSLCWSTDQEDYEPGTGLRVKLKPQSSYGLDLSEHPEFRGKGVGLACLAYSLRETRNEGARVQYTIVQADNRKMLSAATQIIGFEKIGEISTRRFCRRPHSTWLVKDQQRSGREIIL